jgi:hypothetical protein
MCERIVYRSGCILNDKETNNMGKKEEKKKMKKLKKAIKKADKKNTKVDRSDIPLRSPAST